MAKQKMESKKLWAIVIIIVVIAALLLVGLLRGGTGEKVSVPKPVYGSPESPTLIERPLFLSRPSGKLGELTSAEQQEIAAFKKKILARVVSNIPLSAQEKRIITLDIATETMAGGEAIMVNQQLYRFNSEELKLISEALAK